MGANDDRKVRIGKHDVVVYPQAVPYLERRLGRSFAAGLTDGAESFAGQLAGSHAVYQLLTALIPSMDGKVPEWEFHGFASEQDWREDGNEGVPDRFNPELAYTFPQLVDAVEMVWKVNRFDAVELLEKIAARFGLDPTRVGSMLEGLLDQAEQRLADAAKELTAEAETEANRPTTPTVPGSEGSST